jgi:hypothetical protein
LVARAPRNDGEIALFRGPHFESDSHDEVREPGNHRFHGID